MTVEDIAQDSQPFNPVLHAEDVCIYEAFRRQIEHEDDLIGHRINWLLAAESFLFVGYEGALSFHKISTFSGAAGSAHLTIYVLPALGIALATLTEAALLAATGRLNELRKEFRSRFSKMRIAPDHPKLTSRVLQRTFGRVQAHCVAPLFFAAWTILLVIPAFSK
jgi:hypothetical protein